MPMLNQLKGHEATFGVLFVDSPLDLVFLIHELAQFRKRFGSGCHPIIAPVLRILNLDLNVSPRPSTPAVAFGAYYRNLLLA